MALLFNKKSVASYVKDDDAVRVLSWCHLEFSQARLIIAC
jgi:hypothetical protein